MLKKRQIMKSGKEVGKWKIKIERWCAEEKSKWSTIKRKKERYMWGGGGTSWGRGWDVQRCIENKWFHPDRIAAQKVWFFRSNAFYVIMTIIVMKHQYDTVACFEHSFPYNTSQVLCKVFSVYLSNAIEVSWTLSARTQRNGKQIHLFRVHLTEKQCDERNTTHHWVVFAIANRTLTYSNIVVAVYNQNRLRKSMRNTRSAQECRFNYLVHSPWIGLLVSCCSMFARTEKLCWQN